MSQGYAEFMTPSEHHKTLLANFEGFNNRLWIIFHLAEIYNLDAHWVFKPGQGYSFMIEGLKPATQDGTLIIYRDKDKAMEAVHDLLSKIFETRQNLRAE